MRRRGSLHPRMAGARKFAFACLLTLPPNAPAYSQGSPRLPPSNTQCGAIADPTSRLACYDNANSAGEAPEAAQSPRWPEFNSEPARAGSIGPQQNLAVHAQPGSTRNKPLVARVVSFSFSHGRTFSVVLDNGQVWQQLDADDGIAQFKKSGPNRVTITRGFLRSFNLRLNDMSAVFKVERVK